uniref:Uncharacterized protein n=1 Tax=Romanomermis culicivorax TaxID=13658 RepID=A0A915LBZ8_ROMCU
MHRQQHSSKLFSENEEDDDSDDVLDFSIKKRKIDDGQRTEGTNSHSLRPSRSSPSLLQNHTLTLNAEVENIKRSLTGNLISDKGFGSEAARAGLGVENSALLKHLNGNTLNGHFAALKPFNDEAKFVLAPSNTPLPISYQMPVNPATSGLTRMPLATQSLLTSPSLQQSTPNHHPSSLVSNQLISQYYQYLLGAQALASLRQKSVVFENGVINNGNGGGHFVSGTELKKG